MSKFGQITTPPNTGFGSGGGTPGGSSFSGAGNTIALETEMLSLIHCEAKNKTPDAEVANWEMTVFSDKEVGVTTKMVVRGWYGTSPETKNYHSNDGGWTDWCCQTKCDDNQLLGGQSVLGFGGADEWSASILAKYIDVAFSVEGITRETVDLWKNFESYKQRGFSVYKKFKPGYCPQKQDAITMMQEATPAPVAVSFWNGEKVEDVDMPFGEAMLCLPEAGKEEKVVDRTAADAMYNALSGTDISTYLEVLRPLTDTFLPDVLKMNPHGMLMGIAKAGAPGFFLGLQAFEVLDEAFGETDFGYECDPWCDCDLAGIDRCWKCKKKPMGGGYSAQKYECRQSKKKVDGVCPTGHFETKEACEKALKEQGCYDPGDPSQ
jgi:hypothetical protein